MLLGQQSEFTKTLVLCANGTAWTGAIIGLNVRELQLREFLTPVHRNILHPALVDRSNVILPPLYIKLSLMKQFAKALDKEGACFRYIQEKFPNLSSEKVEEGVFVGP